MKPTLRIFIILAALLPVLASAAQADKTQKKRPGAAPSGDMAEALKPFDKNGNQQIDGDELAALQKTFGVLRKLDKNTNGEIEQSEVAQPKPSPASTGKGTRNHAFAGIQKADKNGNHKIDADEIEGLQKLLVESGAKIMAKLDQNKNGKLEESEVAMLNDRIASRGKSPASPPPQKKPSAPAPMGETVKPAKKSDDSPAAKPAAPEPTPKTPGNFGN